MGLVWTRCPGELVRLPLHPQDKPYLHRPCDYDRGVPVKAKRTPLGTPELPGGAQPLERRKSKFNLSTNNKDLYSTHHIANYNHLSSIHPLPTIMEVRL